MNSRRSRAYTEAELAAQAARREEMLAALARMRAEREKGSYG